MALMSEVSLSLRTCTDRSCNVSQPIFVSEPQEAATFVYKDHENANNVAMV